MNLLIAFSPFLLFAVLEHVAGVMAGLMAAAALAGLFVLRDVRSGHVKLLEVGTLVLFAGLAALAAATGARWSVLQVRLFIDSGLLAIVLLSLLLGRPFTLPYARAQAPVEVWASPRFLRMNKVISAAWALAFAAVVAADAAMLMLPSMPLWAGIAVTLGALLAAWRFSNGYPERLQARRVAAARPLCQAGSTQTIV
jgi:hypothetical protein